MCVNVEYRTISLILVNVFTFDRPSLLELANEFVNVLNRFLLTFDGVCSNIVNGATFLLSINSALLTLMLS